MTSYPLYNRADRTPDELERLEEFRLRAESGKQYQLWDGKELKGTYLTLDVAIDTGRHIWKHKGYEETRAMDVSGYGYEIHNIDVQSPVDKRWMSTNTFILEVTVNKSLEF